MALWLANFYSGGRVFDPRHQDGTEILVDNLLPQPANRTDGQCLPRHLDKVGPCTYSFKHPFWLFDSTGNLAATGLSLEQITVHPHGNNYSGTFTFETYDLPGNQTF